MIDSVFHITFSIVTLSISYILFKKAAGSLSILKPNMISYVFYFNLIVESAIASILIVLDIDNHYMLNNISESTRFKGWLIVNYTLIAMPLGMLVAKWIFWGNYSMKCALTKYVSRPINVSYQGKGLKYTIWIITIISMSACLYTFAKIGYIPILKVFQGGDLATLRIIVSRNFSGNEYIKNLLALGLMPALSYAWCFYYLEKRKLKDLLLFLTTAVLAINILYYNFAKAPVLWYLLSYVFVYYYAFGKINKKLLLFSCSLVLLLLVFFYSLSGIDTQQFLNYNSGPIGRIILSQAGGLYTMLQIFPDTVEHIGFSSISKIISNLSNLEYTERSSRIAMAYFNPKGIEAGTAGVMNSLFMGEAWANFGLIGIITAPFWVGMCIQSLYIFFLKLPKSPIFLAFFVTFSFGGSITGGFNDYIYNPGIIVNFSMLVLIILFAFTLNNALSTRK